MTRGKNQAGNQKNRCGKRDELFSAAQKAGYAPFPLISRCNLQAEAPCAVAIPRERRHESSFEVRYCVPFQKTASCANNLRYESASHGISEHALPRDLIIATDIVIALSSAFQSC